MGNTLLRRSLLSFFFIMVGAFLAYLWRRYLALQLSVADYGLLFSIIAFFSILVLFVDIGMEPSVTKSIVELRLAKKYGTIRSLSFAVLGIQLFISLVLYVVVFFLADFLALHYFHAPEAGLYIQLLGLWFLTTPLIIFLSYLLQGFERTTWYTAIDFFRMAFLLVFSFVLFSFDYGTVVPFVAYAVLHLFLFCLYVPYILSYFPDLKSLSFRVEKKLLVEVFSYGFVMALTAFGWIVITQTDTLALTYLTSLEAVGLYNVALPISLLILFFTRPVTIVYYPHVTALATEKKYGELGSIVSLAYKYLFVLLLPVSLVFMLLPEYIIPLLFSMDYVSAGPALQLLALGTLFYGFSMFNNVVFNSLGKAKYMALITALIALGNLVLNFVFIPLLGIQGAALSTSISYFALFLVSTYYLGKFVLFSFPLARWLLVVLSGLIGVCVVLFVKNALLWNNLGEAALCGVILFVVYTVFLFVFRVVSIAECRDFARSLLRR